MGIIIHLQCYYAPDVDIYIKYFACVGIIVNYRKILKSVSYVYANREEILRINKNASIDILNINI